MYSAIVWSSGHVHRRPDGFSLAFPSIAGKFSSDMVTLGDLVSGILSLLPYCTDAFKISPHFFSPSQSVAYSGRLLISDEPVAHPQSRIGWPPHRARAHARN